MKKSFPAGENMDLGTLPTHWQAIDLSFDKVEKLQELPAHALTARAFDLAQVAGHRPYMEVERYLGVARDHDLALRALLEHHGATLWAPWSLLRPAFETSFLAAWILDPTDGRERRARGLRCEVIDTYEQRKHRAAFKAFPEVKAVIEENEARIDANAVATYRAEAAKLGRNFDTLRQRINVTQELH